MTDLDTARPMANSFEVAGRAVKVSRLVDAIDRTFEQVLPSPPEVRARAILICLPEWGTKCWAYLCDQAGVKHAPSETTIGLIRAVYERRAQKEAS